MTLVGNRQHENQTNAEILALLIELRDVFGMNWQEVGQKILVAPSTLSRISTGKKTGGPQLLAGLRLLVELQQNRGIKFPDMDIQVRTEARAKACGKTVEEFAGICLARYGVQTADDIITGRVQFPPSTSENPALNEEAKSNSDADPTAQKIVEAVEKRASELHKGEHDKSRR